MPQKENEYALYKGDEFVAIGTAKQLAERMNVQIGTIKFWSSPTYHRRIIKHNVAIVVIKMEEEDDTN